MLLASNCLQQNGEGRQGTKPQSEKNLEVFPSVHAADSNMRPEDGCDMALFLWKSSTQASTMFDQIGVGC